ncbi:MAG: hypothetical protein ACKPKO_00450, partial [Candidatus Fonsibacter sp.]
MAAADAHPPNTINHTPNTFRLRFTNLPFNFAQQAPHSGTTLACLIQHHLGITIYNVNARYKWVNKTFTHAYAFADVSTAPEGDYIIDNARTIPIHNQPPLPLRAECGPRTHTLSSFVSPLPSQTLGT